MTAYDYLILIYFAVLVVLLLAHLARGGFWWRPLLIVLVLSLCTLSLWYPGRFGPSQRLKPGLDLAGGTELVYDVRVPSGQDASRIIDETIEVLKSRVDPNGTLNLVWRQVAGNRIEIQMALANARSVQLRKAYAEAQKSLMRANFTKNDLDAALRGDPERRRADFARWAGDSAELSGQLTKLAEAHEAFVAATPAYQAAQSAHRAAVSEGADEKKIDELLAELEQRTAQRFEVRRAFEDQRKRVLSANVSGAKLRSVLDLDDVKRDDAGETARGRALAALLTAHPDRAAQITAVADAWSSYEKVKGGLDDPNDLIALLQGSGVVEFRIAAEPGDPGVDVSGFLDQLQEQGPHAGAGKVWRWFPIDDIERYLERPSQVRELEKDPQGYLAGRGVIGTEYGGRYYVLLANAPGRSMTCADKGWELTSVSPGVDDLGQSALNFEMNPVGASLLGTVTGSNVGRQMAILLDGRIISNPVLRSRITGFGQISGGTGGFSQDELGYLLRTLRAGSLEGELGKYPISIKTIGPQMGVDNRNAGFTAAVGALALVAVFMAFYYLLAGLVADFALLANMVIILGVMSMIEATWTLPGIAGVVLTIGMAVDANVLIFERIREERDGNADLPTAVRLGYEKALSTIIDANVTTLFMCLILGGATGIRALQPPTEIKGFAVTLGIGILATLFTAPFCTRVFLTFFIDYMHVRSLPMLPSLVAAINRLLSPTVDWIGRRYLFFTLSAAVLAVGVIAISIRHADMLDIEFRSGTAVSFELAEGKTLPIDEVRRRLDAYAEVAAAMAREGFDESRLSPEQRAIHERLATIAAEADLRYEVELKKWNDADAVTRRLTGEPRRADLSLLGSEHADIVTEGSGDAGPESAYGVSTLITDSQAVSAVIKEAFADVLSTTQPVAFAGQDAQDMGAAPAFIVRSSDLGAAIDRPMVSEDVQKHLGGVAVVLDDLAPPPTIEEVEQRIGRMRLQPKYETLGFRETSVFGLDAAPGGDADGPQRYRSVAVVTHDVQGTNYVEDEDGFTAIGGLAETEWNLIRDAMRTDSSLASVSNFSPAVSGTMQTQAILIIIFGLVVVVAYIWLRFGSLRYGLAAIVALVHDVTITLGLVAATGWIANFGPMRALMIEPFKIDLAMVAALLTIVGYSLNDTIVVFDRIRENRGRMARPTQGIINNSINQTISRTVLTSGTTLLALLTLYFFGGTGVHGFAFAMLIGVAVGTYSSVAVAAPMLLLLGTASERRTTSLTPSGAAA